MAGIALVLDLIRKSPGFNGNTLQSTSLLSATLAASTAAAGTPFASRALFGEFQGADYFMKILGVLDEYSLVSIWESHEAGKFIGILKICIRIELALNRLHCDAGPPLTEDYLSSIRTASENILQYNNLGDNTKEYNIQLKPLFSAFEWKAFALTSLRSFLLFYLPILGPRVDLDEDDDDFPQETTDDQHVDLVVPFKKSVKQIFRETTVVTTRRVLERLAIHHLSQRMAWKLLKDLPMSAVRKADRGMPTLVYFFSVGRSTFRGHFLGVAASWLVQVGIEIYRFFSDIFKSKEVAEEEDTYKVVRFQLLIKRVYGTSVRCGSSLVFASIGAGLGATLFRPSSGQSVGCLVGDLAGPIIVTYCCEKYLHVDI